MLNKICVSQYNLINKIKMPEKIAVYDSTLRDGEQMPGIAFTPEQKMTIARKLDEIGVPQIEIGFPAVSENERKAIKMIANAGLNAELLVLSRLSKNDVDFALTCDIDMVLLFVASSDIHLKYKLKCTKGEVKERVTDVVRYAKDHGLKTSFSTEDSTRTALSFLKELYLLAMNSGADRIGITDTIGCVSPEGMKYLVKKVKEFVTLPVSVHCHNDFGFALSNAIAAVEAGASAVATTVNGIGERAGNVPLEEFVIVMKVLYGKDLGIDTTRLTELSQLVAKFSGIGVPRNKPIVGENAFTHESGMHVSAILNNPITYESIPPELVGNERRIQLGKHSGIGIVRHKLVQKKLIFPANKIEKILKKVKLLGEKKGTVSNKEFWEIVEGVK